MAVAATAAEVTSEVATAAANAIINRYLLHQGGGHQHRPGDRGHAGEYRFSFESLIIIYMIISIRYIRLVSSPLRVTGAVTRLTVYRAAPHNLQRRGSHSGSNTPPRL